LKVDVRYKGLDRQIREKDPQDAEDKVDQ
jgi:hypothetical protein